MPVCGAAPMGLNAGTYGRGRSAAAGPWAAKRGGSVISLTAFGLQNQEGRASKGSGTKSPDQISQRTSGSE
jgi:hypothetical protein